MKEKECETKEKWVKGKKRGSAWKKNIWLWSGIAKTKKLKIKLGFRETKDIEWEKGQRKKFFHVIKGEAQEKKQMKTKNGRNQRWKRKLYSVHIGIIKWRWI